MEIATEIAGESFGVGGELDRIDLCGGTSSQGNRADDRDCLGTAPGRVGIDCQCGVGDRLKVRIQHDQ
jgi:hypothetical protein